MSYWRAAEFAYVWQQLAGLRAARILDVGSPKDLASFLAASRGHHVTATDILPGAVELSRAFAKAQGREGEDIGQISSQVQDARHLSYGTDSFDAAYTVSVIEHIPDDGDSLAIAELVRVVKPGGLIVITTPYDRRYRETFVEGRVYERESAGLTFFERHYDDATIVDRIIRASNAELVDLQHWGELAFSVEAFLARVGRVRTALSPVEGWLAQLNLRRVDPNDTRTHPMAVFLTLRKPPLAAHVLST
ncbi:MAG TPA: class I SAM-dependent methyltransferase [Gemmatimonadaceae bacterium]|nr:class I SAM-dependent methyltransferase [Gemmatimonadaceae bacterium]